MAASATSAGALKQYIEGLGLGISVDRDRASVGAKLPYITVTEGLNTVFDGMESIDAESPYRTVVEMCQIDVWQGWRDPNTNDITESYTLVPSILRALHQARLPASPTVNYGVIVIGSRRMTELDTTPTLPDGSVQSTGLVHNAITVNIRRQA